MGIEKPTFKQKWQRFKDVYFNGKAVVSTISRDEETGGYRIDNVVADSEDVPTEAVHNSGESSKYTIDRIKVRYPYREYEKGFSAIDLYLWMINNDINDCLAYKWNGMQFFSNKKMWLIIGIATVAVIAFYVIKGGI